MNRRPTKVFPYRILPLLALASLLVSCGSGREHAEAPLHDDHADHDDHGATHAAGTVIVSEAAAASFGYAEAVEREVSAPLSLTAEAGWNEDRLAHVTPRIPGRITSVRASLGEEVERGRPLAMLDSLELAQAKSDYLAARSRLELAQKNFEREAGLREKGVSSEREYLEANNDLEEARIATEAAREHLSMLGLSRGEIRGLSHEDSLALFPLDAPIDGTVVDKHVVMGEVVGPEEKLFTIVDTGEIWLWLNVYEDDLSRISEGDPVQVVFRAYPGERFEGRVSYSGSAVLPETRTVRVRVDVPNPEGRLRAGMFATARVSAGESHRALLVPEEAIQEIDGEAAVFVPEGGGSFEIRPVRPGPTLRGMVVIESGLEPGERVVTEGAFTLKSEVRKEELGGGHSH